MTDAIDELMQHSKERGNLGPMLNRAYKLHKANPQLLDFLVQELRDVRESGWSCASVRSLWEYARWVLAKRRAPGEKFAMANAIAPYYARLICILHPDFNSFFVMNKSQADEDLGTNLEPVPKPGHVRRLMWADGTEIENGWRPTTPHEPKPVQRRERVRRKPATSVGLHDVHAEAK